jgi:hypothetical protein
MQRIFPMIHPNHVDTLFFQFKENSPLAALAAWRLGVPSVALTLGRTIHLHGTSATEICGQLPWLRHELKHVEQYHRLGMLRFLSAYAWASLRRGYAGNRFEVEARAAEQDDRYTPLSLDLEKGRGLVRLPN